MNAPSRQDQITKMEHLKKIDSLPIQKQIKMVSPILGVIIEHIFKSKNEPDIKRLQLWVIQLIECLKNNEKNTTYENPMNLENIDSFKLLPQNKFMKLIFQNRNLFEFTNPDQIITFFLLLKIQFNVHWLIWKFGESLFNPILFLQVTPLLYHLYASKLKQPKKSIQDFNSNEKQNNEWTNCHSNSLSDNFLLVYRRNQIELIIDHYLPLLEIDDQNFKEKSSFFSFILDEAIEIVSFTLTSLIETIESFAKTENENQIIQNIKAIDKAVKMFQSAMDRIDSVFKISVRQLKVITNEYSFFYIFIDGYKKLDKSLLPVLLMAKNQFKDKNDKSKFLSKLLTKLFSTIIDYKESILLQMVATFNRRQIPDFHFPMLSFVLKTADVGIDLDEMQTEQTINTTLNIENEPNIESNVKNDEINSSEKPASQLTMPAHDKNEIESNKTENPNKNPLYKQIALSSIPKNKLFSKGKKSNKKDRRAKRSYNSLISYTKLSYLVADQGFIDQNDILAFLNIINRCKQSFSLVSIQNMLEIASSNPILHRTAIWALGDNKALPDRLFACPGIVTLCVYYALRAFEFLSISRQINKYHDKQQMVIQAILTLYKRIQKAIKPFPSSPEQSQLDIARISSSSSISSIDIRATPLQNTTIDDDDDDGISKDNKFDDSKSFMSADLDNLENEIQKGYQMITEAIELCCSLSSIFMNCYSSEFDVIEKCDLDIFYKETVEPNICKSHESDIKVISNLGRLIHSGKSLDFIKSCLFIVMLNELIRNPIQRFDLKNICGHLGPSLQFLVVDRKTMKYLIINSNLSPALMQVVERIEKRRPKPSGVMSKSRQPNQNPETKQDNKEVKSTSLISKILSSNIIQYVKKK